MKKLMRTMALLLVAMLMMTAFAGCNSDKDDNDSSSKSESSKYDQYDGDVYAGTYEYNGSEFDVTIILKNDDTYRKITIKDGEPYADIEGDYEWDESGELRLYDNDKSWLAYTYSNGVLTNNKHEFKKVKSGTNVNVKPTTKEEKKSPYDQYDGVVYAGSYTYNGSNFEVIIALEDSDTYRKVTKKDDGIYSDVTGKYEWRDSKKELRLYDGKDNDRSWWTYSHSNGVLTNNNHEFKRVK